MIPTQLIRELVKHDIAYELITHPRTMTAGDEAEAVGATRDEVAKTLVLSTPAGHVRAVVPAAERLDIHKLRTALGDGKDVRLATESELADAYPMFELGAVPPFGGPVGDRTIVDRRLAERDSIVLEAGSHTESVRLRGEDLVALTKAGVADISVDGV